MHYKSADGPTFVQLVGDTVAWVTPLKVAATALLSSFSIQLGKRAADEFWDNRKLVAVALRDAAAAPLLKVATALSTARSDLPSQSSLRVGIPVPSDYFGTFLELSSPAPHRIALDVAVFVLSAEAIQALVESEAQGDRPPIGTVALHIKPGGGAELRWVDASGDKQVVSLPAPKPLE